MRDRNKNLIGKMEAADSDRGNPNGSAAAQCGKIDWLYLSIVAGGFAAAQCGKALPYR